MVGKPQQGLVYDENSQYGAQITRDSRKSGRTNLKGKMVGLILCIDYKKFLYLNK